MRRIFVAMFIAAFALSQASAHDPIAVELKAAKKTFELSIETAKAKLVADLENAEKTVLDRKTIADEKTLARIKKIRDERDEFKESGVVPETPELRTNVADYHAATLRAEATMVLEYDKAIDACTKKGQANRAAELADEKKSFIQESEERRIKAWFNPLIGRWSIETNTHFKSEWTFTPDGIITATEGGALRGKWKHESEKQRIAIYWEGLNIVDWLALPLKREQPAQGGSSQNSDIKITATKIK